MKKRKNSRVFFKNEQILAIRDYINIDVCDKTLNLKYRTRFYKKFDTTKHSVTKVKNHGYQTMCHKGEYYALSRVIDVQPEKRKEVINKILSIKVDGNKIIDHVNHLWELNCKKSQDKNLAEFDTKFLSALSDYFIAGHEKDDILDEFRWEKIRKYESPVEMKSYSNKKFIKHKITNKTFEQRFRRQYKNWNKSISRKYYTVVGKFIDLNSEYKSNWCYVNQDNIFQFLNNTYKISNDVKQYKIKANEDISMFKILSIHQNNSIHFFDENFDHIKSNFIKKIEE